MPDDRHSLLSGISAIEDRLHEQGSSIGDIKGDVSSIKGNMGAMNLRLETVAQTGDAAAASSADIRQNLGTALTALTRVQSLIGDPSADDTLIGDNFNRNQTVNPARAEPNPAYVNREVTIQHGGPATVNLNRAGAAAVNPAANVNRGGGFPDSGATAEEDVIVDPNPGAPHQQGWSLYALGSRFSQFPCFAWCDHRGGCPNRPFRCSYSHNPKFLA